MAISASTWARVDGIGLNQAIDSTSTTQQHALGERVICKDVSSNARGFGEFVYALGVASTAAGDLVILESGHTTIRASARDEGPCAVAMSANVANQYGWYQVRGRAVVTAGTVADNAQVYLSATAGSIDDAHVAGDDVKGARTAGATDTGFALVDLMYPAVSDHDNA